MTRTVVQVGVVDAVALAAGAPSPWRPWVERADAVLLADPQGLGASGRGRGAEATVLAAALIERYPGARWIVEVSFARDYPYNVARRVASLAALSATGIGVMVDATPTVLPGVRVAAPAAIAADGITALQELWQSWPTDSVVADRSARRFVDAARIRHVGHDGVFRVDGPLQTPVDREDQPVVFQRLDPAAHADTAGADVLITGGSGVGGGGDDPRPRLRLVSATAARRDALHESIVITGAAVDVVAALEARDAAGSLSPGIGSLRARLGVAAPRDLLRSSSAAFVKEQW